MTTTITKTTPAPTTTSHSRIIPIRAGWALDAAGVLDEHVPGFLRYLFQSKARSRQAIFAAIASGVLEDPTKFLANAAGVLTPTDCHQDLALVANLFMTMSPRDVVAAAFGPLPGFLGALDRVGDQPLERDDYTKLLAILRGRGEEASKRRKALAHGGRITSAKLAVVEVLHPALLHVNFFPKVRCQEHAETANDVVSVVLEFSSTATPATPATIAKAVADMNSGTRPSQFLVELLKMVDRLPEGPIIAHPELRLLRTPKDFAETGQRFRNCLGQKAYSHALTGRAAFYEYMGEDGGIAVVINAGDQWVLGRVHAHSNHMLPEGLLEAVRDAFAASGIPCLIPHVPEGRMASVAGLFEPLGYMNFMLDADSWDEDEG